MDDNMLITNKFIADNIDSSIIECIRDTVSCLDDKLEIAIAIYIKVAQIFWYSPSFVVDNDYSKIEDLSKITLGNNNIVCLHWAVIYSKLLDLYGIKNELKGNDEHLYVKLFFDEYFIDADATSYGVEYREYRLADLTNAKLDLMITGFRTLSTQKNEVLNKIIKRVYNKIKVKCFDENKLDRILEKYRIYFYKRMISKKEKGLPIIDREEILIRVLFLNRFYSMNSKLHSVERLQIFAKYYKHFFNGFDYDNSKCISLSEEDENGKHLIKLLVFKDCEGNFYYFLECSDGFVEYTKEKLLDEFKNRNLTMKFEIYKVLGFMEDEVRILSKK